MNSLSLNVLAVSIFSITMLALVGPIIDLSPVVPASIAFGALGLVTIDTLGFDGQGTLVFLDWLGDTTSDRRERVIRHEAGHFLVACLLDIPVSDYTLSAWEAVQRGQRGRGGVQFDDRELREQLQRGTISAPTLDRYAKVWMAGIAAEQLHFDRAVGGDDDRAQLRQLFRQLRPAISDFSQRERLAVFQAKTLIEVHRDTYNALVEAMTQSCSVEACRLTVTRGGEMGR
ncbi:MAG: ATP-dependent Zn protease [Cyanobacteria bacterium SID2]|nr:ATP-dependent Zn protease [Cyanobacteria bacterium SID2]MBP0004778.1 ATP-dependent Zn protease [Cyanobacteria bacterium SBC]